jgi:HSP20 family protein
MRPSGPHKFLIHKELRKKMSLTHFDPLASIRVFEDAFTRMVNEPRATRPWSPAVDIYETENELVLKADVPDVDPSAIDVRVENQTLTISGERKFEADSTSKGFHRIERSYGNFVRSFAVRRLQEWRPQRHPSEEGSRQAASGESRSKGVMPNGFLVRPTGIRAIPDNILI